MRRAVHLAALRMASKVALSGAVLSCTTSPTPILPTTESAPEAGKPTEKLSCTAVIAKAFPTEGKYPGEKQNVSAEVSACCREVLLEHFCMAPHRWDCCANVDLGSSNNLHAACTPWGPPTPPSVVAARVSPRGALDLRGFKRIALPAIPALRDAAIETWRGRMVNEHASASVFSALAQQLARAGIDAREVSAFADEERRHGALCGAVVESLGGEAIGELPAAPEFPLHADAATPLEAVLRNVLSVCCLSETVAVALIGAERLEMPEGELCELLTTIWSDEVGHARFGWRLLSQLALDAAIRERLADYLELAFAHLVEHELAHLPLASSPPPEGVVYGLCNGRDARRLFFDTVEQVIVPRLEAHGIGARRAWGRASASGAARAAGAGPR